MKYEKERQLAKQVMQERLGFAPALMDIIPLESDIVYGQCTYVNFVIKNHNLTVYSANRMGDLFITYRDKEILMTKSGRNI